MSADGRLLRGVLGVAVQRHLASNAAGAFFGKHRHSAYLGDHFGFCQSVLAFEQLRLGPVAQDGLENSQEGLGQLVRQIILGINGN